MMPLSWFALQTTAGQRRSEQSPTSAKHAYEMGTSDLHRTSIMLAAAAMTTNRSMDPKGFIKKPPESQDGHNPSEVAAMADQFDCLTSLDRGDPVTDVLTLY